METTIVTDRDTNLSDLTEITGTLTGEWERDFNLLSDIVRKGRLADRLLAFLEKGD